MQQGALHLEGPPLSRVLFTLRGGFGARAFSEVCVECCCSRLGFQAKAIDVNIDGKLFCLAHMGQAKHKDALQLCQNLNASLPLPRNLKEHRQFIESFKRLGIEKKMKDVSTKIVLDVRRLPKKGKVTFFLFSTVHNGLSIS